MCAEPDTHVPTLEEIEAKNQALRSHHHLSPTAFEFHPIPTPVSPDAFCSISAIRTGTMHIPQGIFITPEPGTDEDVWLAPAFAFLVEHEEEGKTRRVIFDLGLRENTAHSDKVPLYLHLAKLWSTETTPGVPKILEASGIPLSSIDSIILGHAHFDHIGDLRPFPPSVDLVIGPDSDSIEQLAEAMDVPIETLKERTVRELSREKDAWADIGTLKGLDYFGDGSLWILDAPGHVHGHINALVRTSTSPPIYHHLGSDTAHHAKFITASDPRPSIALFPSPEDPRVLRSMHEDIAKAYETMAKVARMDSEENINVFLAHDTNLGLALGPGDLVKLEGTKDELNRLKTRKRY